MRKRDDCPICGVSYALNQKFKTHVRNCKPFEDSFGIGTNPKKQKQSLDQIAPCDVPDLDFEPFIEQEKEFLIEIPIKGNFRIIL